MSVEQILAALGAVVAEATAGGTDGDGTAEPQLSEEQAARYEALEAQLVVARKSEEIVKRNAAYRTVTTPIVNGKVGQVDGEINRAFESYLRTGRLDSGLISRAQNEASGPAGGYFVPDTFRDKLIERQKAFGGLMNAAESVTTSTGAPLVWMTNDDVLSTEAGIIGENAANTFGADFTFARNALNAYKYDTAGVSGIFLKVSWELLQDSVYDLQGFIARKFAERIQRKVAVDLINGSGVNEPVGIISTMGALTSSGVTLASATAGPTYAELVTIEHSLDPIYRDGASWLMNDKTLGFIESLVDTTGRPLVWNTGNSIDQGRMPKQLLGYPIVVDQAMPDMLTGSTKGMVFGDLSQAYVVRKVKDFTMVTASELFAQNGQIGYLGWLRLDGMVQNVNAAVTVTSHA